VQHTIELFNEVIPKEFWQSLKDENLLDQAAPIPSSVVSAL
jgi:D-threo-aldose 1-dehydrogenase